MRSMMLQQLIERHLIEMTLDQNDKVKTFNGIATICRQKKQIKVTA